MGQNLGDFGRDILKNLEPNKTIESFKEAARDLQLELSAERATARLALAYGLKEKVFYNKNIKKKAKSLSERLKIQKAAEAKSKLEKIAPVEHRKQTAEEFAHQFKETFPEIEANKLMELHDAVILLDDIDDILDHVKRTFPDVTAADIALEYLLQVTEGNNRELIQGAKEKWNELHGRRIVAGYNVAREAMKLQNELSKTSPNITAGYLRDLYRDVSARQPAALELFSEFSKNYSYREMLKVTRFLFHAAGQDMNSGGPSIEPGRLHVLMGQVKALQATLGIYRFFKSRENLLKKQYRNDQLTNPPDFENTAKAFVNLLVDRYLQGSKVINSANQLGADKQKDEISKKLAAVYIIELWRDAVPNLDNKRIEPLEKNAKPITETLIETLENLYLDLDELYEQEELNQTGS
ncbi:MAG: hypothetical protein Tsb0021_00210 [Chlamydiales bacterium]